MKILVAEDDPVSRRLLTASLEKWGYQVTAVPDGDQAAAALAGPDAPPVAILDWEMPGRDGPTICREVRAAAREPYTWLILLTGRTEKTDLVAGLAAGADDYVVKPVDPTELEVRLRAARRIVKLQSDLIAAREEMRIQAATDALTGLWNHGAVVNFVERELVRSERTSSPMGIVMADLDKFKSINDTHGHPVGDAVLRQAADRLRTVKRPYDYLGRYGGEEFLVVLPGCDRTDAAAWAERARLAIADVPFTTGAGPLNVTLSLGVAAVAAGVKADRAAVVGAADAALYRAKRAGRNRVETAGDGETAETAGG